jgi:Bardet-Biedl syndrome 2 protein
LGFSKVFIHNPHKKHETNGQSRFSNIVDNGDVSLLNINAMVTSLAAGRFDDSNQSDSLLVGTSTNLLAYDVNNNVDLFYKDVS